MTRLLSETEIISAAAGAGSAKCGVYFLIKDGEVKYVGQSIDIDARKQRTPYPLLSLMFRW